MKQDEAKILIRKEYQVWIKSQKSITAETKFLFYSELYKKKSYLLNFKYSGVDQWQTVNKMLVGL